MQVNTGNYHSYLIASFVVVFGLSSDILKLFWIISRADVRVKFETILKIPRAVILFVYT